MLNFIIIPIRDEYIDSYWSALDSVAREQSYLAFLKGPPLEMTRDFVKQNREGNWPHLIALHENEVIGWCDISALDRPVFAHIGSLGIGVRKAYRGMGVGKALLAEALRQAREKGLTRIELTVREHNKAALALYHHVGFVIEGIHKNAVRIDGRYENHLSMALLFE
ncbi:GNAT family acetyltransferase [Legionella rubrilucens]|uniref:GNAT family acetyltransferase n=1 Tax=Legionella rubrilucens TaxID=458 RepID=A0A0W0XYW8_9GAMM|nr:GNAT family N-acetyltransferase [Legionella rubrilucens]KTD49492.1 GNAT family acetyltransferase [Legionella rubrilucens]